MTTQYTTILKLALPVQGELSGTWGDVVNNNITSMVEQAVAGKATVNSWTTNSHTLTTADGTTSESRCAVLELTDSGTALTGAGTVICPTNSKLYIVDNNTAQIVTIKTSAGTGIAVPVGKTMLVYCDGTNVVEGITHANSLSLGTSTVTVSSVLDQDNMSSDSATALATQQSIKAYVDSQVGTVDTLAEILANGNTTGGTDIATTTTDKVQFRDSAIYINSSADGQLDIVADTEIQIAATTIDINGAINASGEIIAASLDISGDIDVDGTTNLDIVDIDGAVDFASTTAHAGNATFADNAKAIFGADSDLQIYHDGLNSYIQDQGLSGTGNLILAGADVEIATFGGNKYFQGASNVARLYHTNNEKLATTATGIDVTGTATMDGLTVSNADGSIVKLESTGTGLGAGAVIGDLQFYGNDASTPGAGIKASITATTVAALGDDSQLMFSTSNGTTNNVNRMLIANNGNVSLYEDTGTTPKFVWDASAESLGIGSLSPVEKLYLSGTSGDTRMGLNAPSGSDTEIKFSNAGVVEYTIGHDDLTDNFVIGGQNVDAPYVSVDKSGNLLVGKTSTSGGIAGTVLAASGLTRLTASGIAVAEINRLSSDGSIIEVQKDGAAVGAMGAASGQLYVGNEAGSLDTGILFGESGTTARAILPCRAEGTEVDGALDIGRPAARWKDLYLSGGVVFGPASGSTVSSETLSSYEEGTWTPAYTGSTGGAVTYGTQTGSYTKVGNLVTVIGVLRAKRNTLSGNVEITGLPFTNSGNGAGLSVNFASAFATDMPNLTGYTTSTKIALRKNATNTASGTPVASTDLADAATTENYLYFSATYLT